jgi:hypothetical protein
MKLFSFFVLFFLFVAINNIVAQDDDPNLDQIPRVFRENSAAKVRFPISSVITLNNWDNFYLGIDAAENNVSANPLIPTWYFLAYNTNGTHHSENGWDWFINNPDFGSNMAGDPVSAYDSIGNLFYENMYLDLSIVGCKVIKSADNGNSWGTAVTAIAGNDKNWIACDQTSGPYANFVYTVMTNNGVGNFARSIDHGETFQSTFAPTTQTLPGMMVCVGPNGDIQGGSVYVVTNSGTAFASTYTFYKSNDGGVSFSNLGGQQFANYVGTDVNGRNSVEGMRTRPYPFIAADNSYGSNRGKLYLVYASNDPPGNGNKPDIWCRSSGDGGDTWSSAVRVNDDPNTTGNHQWHPATWCDKETGRLYVMWMDTRDTPTHDSAYIYASYSDDGGISFVSNQQISNKKMKINCTTCGGGGTPRYQGDYNGIGSNKKVSLAGWADFRQGTFMSMAAYFPDFAMAVDHSADTLFSPSDIATFQVSIPAVKLYTDTVLLSGVITPSPTSGSMIFNFPQGNTISSFPSTTPVELILSGNVPSGIYQAVFVAMGPNGTPVHKRTASITVAPSGGFYVLASATPSSICYGASSQLDVNVTGGTPPYDFSWTPVDSLNNSNIQNPIANPTETTTYIVTATDASALVSQSSVILTVNNAPPNPGPITGNSVVCEGDTGIFTIENVLTATNYSWTIPEEAQVIGPSNTPSITIRFGSISGNISVIASNSCGITIPSVLFVQVSKVPQILSPIYGPDALCSGASDYFFVLPAVGAISYTWSFPSDVTIIGEEGEDTVHVIWGNSAGEVSVFGENLCGSGPVVTKTVTLAFFPGAAGPITGKDTVCLTYSGYSYAIDEIPGVTGYTWSFPPGSSIDEGVGTNNVIVSFGAEAISGEISVRGVNSCGEGEISTKNVLVLNCAGIHDTELNSKISLFPNPATNHLSIVIRGTESRLRITLTDLMGALVYTELLENLPPEYIKKLDLSSYTKGSYFITIQGETGHFSEMLILR